MSCPTSAHESLGPLGKKQKHDASTARNLCLLQFELTSKRNRWTDTEKTVNLLCALDGQARSILSEIDDAEQTTYSDVKQILTKRFGPLQHTEIHEQALRDLRLSRGQLIRELAPEAVRLAKLASVSYTHLTLPTIYSV